MRAARVMISKASSRFACRSDAGSVACSAVSRIRPREAVVDRQLEEFRRELRDLARLVVAAAQFALAMQRHRQDRIDGMRASFEQASREHRAENPRDRDLAAVLQPVNQFDQREFVAVRARRRCRMSARECRQSSQESIPALSGIAQRGQHRRIAGRSASQPRQRSSAGLWPGSRQSRHRAGNI